MHEAFLIGVRSYADHTLPSVANDLVLLAAGLEHQGYAPSAIHTFDDTHTTLAALRGLFSDIGARYAGAAEGSCLVHIGASGALRLDPPEGGVLTSDGDPADFATAFAFAELNTFLPLRPGIRVTAIVDTWHGNLAVDRLSADATLLTIGGADKLSCRVKDVLVKLPDGTQRLHGPLSWALGAALGAVPPGADWIAVLEAMRRLMREQGWLQPLLFRGQVTDPI